MAAGLVLPPAGCGNEAKIIGIDVMLDDVELVVGLSTQAHAIVTWVDGRSGEPVEIEWISTDTSVATVDGKGWVTGVGEGVAGIEAGDPASGLTAQALLRVLAPSLLAVRVTPDAPSLAAGLTGALPYVGQVDTSTSYYVVTGLTPGFITTVSIDANDDADLFVYNDLFVTRLCSSSSFSGQESCDVTVPAGGTLTIEISGFAATTNPGALFTLTLSAGVAPAHSSPSTTPSPTMAAATSICLVWH